MNIQLEEYQKAHHQSFVLLCMELFFIVFSIHIKGFSGVLTLRNLAMAGVIAIFVVFFISKKPPIPSTSRIDQTWFVGMTFMLFYAILVSLANSAPLYDSHSCFRSTVNFFIMVVILPFILSRMEFSIKRLVKALTLATTVQALIVIGCFLSPVFKAIIFNLQEWDDNFLYYRVSGLGIAGSGGTVYLFCGFLANVYYLMFYGKTPLYYATLFIVFFATMLVGRTGFYIEVILFVYMMIRMHKYSKTKGPKILPYISFASAIVILVFAVGYVQSKVSVDYEMLGSSYRRLNDIFEGETINEIQQMAVPNITFASMFFGTGVEKGLTLDGMMVWNDSGYVQRFLSFGLIPAFLFYYILMKYLFALKARILEKEKRRFWLIVIAMMFVIEYKEAFIFYLALPFTIIMCLKLELYEQQSK